MIYFSESSMHWGSEIAAKYSPSKLGAWFRDRESLVLWLKCEAFCFQLRAFFSFLCHQKDDTLSHALIAESMLYSILTDGPLCSPLTQHTCFHSYFTKSLAIFSWNFICGNRPEITFVDNLFIPWSSTKYCLFFYHKHTCQKKRNHHDDWLGANTFCVVVM